MARKRPRPVAAVYRGPISSPGCSEALAALLRRSPARFEVHYLGPRETQDITAAALSTIDLLAWPGGGDDQASDYKQVAHYTPHIQAFVRAGGLYLGVCLGAFLARGPASDEGFFELLSPGSYVSSERFEKGAEVQHGKDCVVRTDWEFASGKRIGQVEMGRWQYFQDGGTINLLPDAGGTILGRYAATSNPCATISSFGLGQVGLIGTHPEADGSWYADWNGRNPDGIRFDLGWDLVMALLEKKTVWNDWMEGT